VEIFDTNGFGAGVVFGDPLGDSFPAGVFRNGMLAEERRPAGLSSRPVW